MTKTEWKSNYSAARMIHSGLVKMMMFNSSHQNNAAIDSVWRTIDSLGMRDVMFGARKRDTFNIRSNRWAVKTNHKGASNEHTARV
jgi:hypothetical protein